MPSQAIYIEDFFGSLFDIIKIVQYNSIANQYDEDIKKDLDNTKLEFELIELTNISNPKGWKVLDVGCGSGIQIEFLAKKFPEIESLTGVDSSKSLIDLALSSKKDARCNYIVSDMHNLPFEDQSFDFVYSRYTVHYSNDMCKVMNELYRILKPGGMVYLQVVHPIYELFKKKSKDYESTEEATFSPQTSTLEIKHVTHTISQYVNAALKSGLKLNNIEERFGGSSNIDSYRIPTVLILRLSKDINK